MPDWIDWLQTDIALLVAIIALLLTLVLGAVAFLLGRRWHTAERRVSDLNRDLRVFSEASTRVADTLDELLLGRAVPMARSQSSRRYLLQRAKTELCDGERMHTVAKRLGLCDDEVRLLERMNGVSG